MLCVYVYVADKDVNMLLIKTHMSTYFKNLETNFLTWLKFFLMRSCHEFWDDLLKMQTYIQPDYFARTDW